MLTRHHSSPRSVLLAGSVVAALAAGMTGGPALAADPGGDSSSPSLTRADDGTVRYTDPSATGETSTISGVLVSEADHAGGDDWSVARSDGTTVPVDVGAVLPESLTAGAVTARVVEDGELAAAAIEPAAQAAPTPSRHTVYLAKVTNRGSYGEGTDAEIDAQIRAVVQRGLDRWVAESNGYITGFDIVETTSGPVEDTTPGDGVACESGMKVWRQFEDDFGKTGEFFDQDGEHLITVQPQGCGGGVGSGGTGINSSGGLTFDLYPAKNTTTIPHELGHNFGLGHATALICEAGTCANSDYGNKYSTMGSSGINNPPTDPGAFDSFDRDKLGILSPGELEQMSLLSGQRSTTAAFSLHGRGTSLATRGVKVIDPVTGQPWYLDFRNAVDRDSNAPYGRKRDRTTGFRLGVTVQKTINDGKQSELQTTSLTDGASNFALRAGESYTTPGGGARVAVTSLDTASSVDALAQLTVTLTNPSVNPPTNPPTGPGGGSASTFTKTVKPTLTGKAVVGRTLKVSLRKQAWRPAPTKAVYRWHVGQRVVRSSATPSLKITQAYRGKRVWAQVTASRPGYKPVTLVTAKQTVNPRR